MAAAVMTDAQALTRALNGKWHGGGGLAFCPAHANKRTPALSLSVGRDGKLLLFCHVGCEFSDVLAALQAKGLLDSHRDWSPNSTFVKELNARAKAQFTRRLAQAKRCWTDARPIAGTLAEQYLRSRGVKAPLPRSLRFHPECWHGPTARRYPAMVARVEKSGVGVGVHRTFLTPDGHKIEDQAKMMLGPVAGGATRLSDGAGPLVIAEGIETALSLVDGLVDHSPRVWAALSTSGVRGLHLPDPPSDLVISPDGDPPGRTAALDLATRATSLGWKVRIMWAPEGADWNDITDEAPA